VFVCAPKTAPIAGEWSTFASHRDSDERSQGLGRNLGEELLPQEAAHQLLVGPDEIKLLISGRGETGNGISAAHEGERKPEQRGREGISQRLDVVASRFADD
jgi:hypothetical protein